MKPHRKLSAREVSGPPGPSLRYTLQLDRLDVIVRGVFPPEAAPAYREFAGIVARKAYPKVRASYEKALREWEHELIYGKPGARTPVGILGISPVAACRP